MVDFVDVAENTNPFTTATVNQKIGETAVLTASINLLEVPAAPEGEEHPKIGLILQPITNPCPIPEEGFVTVVKVVQIHRKDAVVLVVFGVDNGYQLSMVPLDNLLHVQLVAEAASFNYKQVKIGTEFYLGVNLKQEAAAESEGEKSNSEGGDIDSSASITDQTSDPLAPPAVRYEDGDAIESSGESKIAQIADAKSATEQAGGSKSDAVAPAVPTDPVE